MREFLSTMKFDFRVHERTGRVGRLTMSLVPGPGDAGGVWIDETAFGFVEPCVTRAWPAYANYGHWGLVKLPIDAWREFCEQLRLLRASLLAADGPDDVVGLGFLFRHLRPLFARRFGEMRQGIVAMIDEILAWSERDCAQVPFVAIHGI